MSSNVLFFDGWKAKSLVCKVLLIGLVGLGANQRTEAEEIQAGATTFFAQALLDVTIFDSASINPTGEELFFDDLSGFSSATIFREQQVGSTITISGLEGWAFEGSNVLGDFRFGIVGPFDGNDYSGAFTNVQQDPNDPGFPTGDPSSFVSGDYFVSGTGFGVEFTSGPLTGIILSTDPSQVLEFESVFDGLPPSPGTLISTTPGSDQFLDLYLSNANGDLLELVGTTSDRRIVVVPEPSSMLVIGLGGIAGLAFRRRVS